jgi:hypothetical protein
MKKYLVIFLAALVAIGRVFITPIIPLSWTDAYIANAHLFAGFLIGVRIYDWKGRLGPTRFYWWIGWGLAFYELAFYLVQKHLAAIGI